MKDEDVQRIVRLRLQGYSPLRIADLCDWPEMLVRAVLKPRGLCS